MYYGVSEWIGSETERMRFAGNRVVAKFSSIISSTILKTRFRVHFPSIARRRIARNNDRVFRRKIMRTLSSAVRERVFNLLSRRLKCELENTIISLSAFFL